MHRRLQSPTLRALLGALLLLPLLLAAGPALAGPPAARIEVWVIHASRQGDEVDPRLAPLKRQLKGFSFSAYQLIERRIESVPAGAALEMALPGERTLKITPEGHEEGRRRVRLEIPGLVNTTYLVDQGGTLIVGGPKHQGGNLILAVALREAASE